MLHGEPMHITVISPTIQEFEGVRYYRCGLYFQRKGVRLHRLVYRKFHGEVQDGHHVHHRDHDYSNNEPENLVGMPYEEHCSYHGKASKAGVRHIDRAQKAAVKWHGSDAGKKWHSEHYEKHIRGKVSEKCTCACTVCGTEYQAQAIHAGWAKYCSNKCKARARRQSGVDNETRTCPVCASEFSANRYSSTQCCSTSCASKRRAAA